MELSSVSLKWKLNTGLTKWSPFSSRLHTLYLNFPATSLCLHFQVCTALSRVKSSSLLFTFSSFQALAFVDEWVSVTILTLWKHKFLAESPTTAREQIVDFHIYRVLFLMEVPLTLTSSVEMKLCFTFSHFDAGSWTQCFYIWKQCFLTFSPLWLILVFFTCIFS